MHAVCQSGRPDYETRDLHSEDKVRLRRLQHQMKVIAHETICVNLPFCFAAALTQGAQKFFPILVVSKNILALISAIHHVIHRPGILNAQRPRHGPTGY